MSTLFSSISTSVKSTKSVASNALGRVLNAGTTAVANQIADEAHRIEAKYSDKVQNAKDSAQARGLQSSLTIGIGALLILTVIYFSSRGK